MKKLSIHLIFFSLLIVALAFSCSTEVEDTTSTPIVQIPDPETEPEPEPEPVPVEYTLSVSSTEGGTVSSEGGTYDEGAEVTITATANEGYAFIGWDGIDSTNETLTITLNSNLSIEPIFQLIQTNESGYYSNGEIVSIDPIVFYDRELVVNGIKLIVAGDIGGQLAVPDFWIYKTARVFELLIDKDGEDIDANSQLNMIKTLKGEIGWHQGYPAGQRIARGGGNEYSPNFLDDNRNQSYPGIEAFEDALALDDMVWYKNIDSQGTGDDDINEILEHPLQHMESKVTILTMPGMILQRRQ